MIENENDLTNLLQERKGLQNKKIRKLLESNKEFLSGDTLKVSIGKYQNNPNRRYEKDIKPIIPIYFKGKEEYQNFELLLYELDKTLCLELNLCYKNENTNISLPPYVKIKNFNLNNDILKNIFDNTCKKYVNKNLKRMRFLSKDDEDNENLLEDNKLYFNWSIDSKIKGWYTNSRELICTIKKVGNILRDYITYVIDKKDIIIEFSRKISNVTDNDYEQSKLIRKEKELKIEELSQKIKDIENKAKKKKTKLEIDTDIELYKIKKEIPLKLEYCTKEVK